MAGETLRFRADSAFPYAQAVVTLTEFARGHDVEFDFGPLDTAGMISSGLVVTGPDLEQVSELMAGIPGLAESEA